MGDAPQKVTFKNANTTIEWFSGDGRIEDKQKYKITLDYYVSNWSGRLMYNFDNNVFLEIGSNMEEGIIVLKLLGLQIDKLISSRSILLEMEGQEHSMLAILM